MCSYRKFLRQSADTILHGSIILVSLGTFLRSWSPRHLPHTPSTTAGLPSLLSLPQVTPQPVPAQLPLGHRPKADPYVRFRCCGLISFGRDVTEKGGPEFDAYVLRPLLAGTSVRDIERVRSQRMAFDFPTTCPWLQNGRNLPLLLSVVRLVVWGCCFLVFWF